MSATRSGHPPATLQAQAEQYANERHSERLAELKTLAPMLAQFDAFTPALAAQGLKLTPDALSLGYARLDPGAWASRRKVLAIRGGMFLRSSTKPAWCTALQGLGFKVLRHDAPSVWPTALLRRAQLLVNVDLSASEAAELEALDKRRAAQAAQAAAADAQPTAACATAAPTLQAAA